MFDIGFSEVLLIFVIALVVLGPEKLPRLASQVGRWIGRARAMARQFREQLEEEVNLEQVRRAHETKPRQPAEPVTPATSESTDSTNTASAGSAPGGGASGASPGSGDSGGSDGVVSRSAMDNSGPGVVSPSQGSSEAAPFTAGTAEHGGAHSPVYTGPDPADLRADTFSHAHPTDEYGANTQTANGAAPQTASEANVAAAQPEPSAEPRQRAPEAEAYASNTPPAPERAENHGHS